MKPVITLVVLFLAGCATSSRVARLEGKVEAEKANLKSLWERHWSMDNRIDNGFKALTEWNKPECEDFHPEAKKKYECKRVPKGREEESRKERGRFEDAAKRAAEKTDSKFPKAFIDMVREAP